VTSNRHQPRHAGRAPFALLLGGLLGGGLILLLGLNTVSAANELRRHDLAARDEQVAASLVELRNAVAASQAPQNLALHAAAYGMVPADNPAFLVVGQSGSVRVLGSPAPATAAPLPPPPASSPAKAAKSKHPKPSSTAHKSASRSASSRASATRAAATKGASPKAGARPTAARSTAARTTAAGRPRSAGATKPTPTPARPSSTPIPTITLPGGTR
jgi:hypothetical protein